MNRKLLNLLFFSAMGLIVLWALYVLTLRPENLHDIAEEQTEHSDAGLRKNIDSLIESLSGIKTAARETPLQNLEKSNSFVNLSHEPGFYDGPLRLIISGPADAYFYTTNGKDPALYGKKYNAPLLLSRTTVLRIAPSYSGRISDSTAAFTYFIGFSTKLPVVSVTTDSNTFFDPETGIYRSGMDVPVTEANYLQANFFKDWERQIWVEFFETDGSRPVSQAAGIRIFGGMTRLMEEKSLRLIARKKYGKSRFKHKFFESKNIGSFKSLVLRTSGGDYRSTRFRDAFSTSLVRDIGLDVQAARTCVLFVNGEYWGLYNLREKIDEHFLEDNHGADPKHTDLLQGNQVVDHGSALAYRNMLDFIRKHPLNDSMNLNELNRKMDIRNFTNYIITQIYLCNVDSRGNVRYWRAGNLDGRFRWILYDTDLGFGASLPASADYLRDAISPVETNWYNPQWSTFLLRSLLQNQGYKHFFINQAAFLLNTCFHQDSVLKKINLQTAAFEDGMDAHLTKTKQTREKWYFEIDKMRRFAKDRPANFRKHISSNFGVGGNCKIILQTNVPNAACFKINGNIVSGSAEGVYFTGVPLTIEVIPVPPFSFRAWAGRSDSSRSIVITPASDIRLEALLYERPNAPVSDSIVISGIYSFCRGADCQRAVKLSNRSASTANLNGFSLNAGDELFRFSTEHSLKPGASVIVASDTAAFRKKTATDASLIAGNLNVDAWTNGGNFCLIDADERLVDQFNFGNPFESGQNRAGMAMTLKSADLSNDFIENWIIHERLPQSEYGIDKQGDRSFLGKSVSRVNQIADILIFLILLIFFV
jgi:hypothetical protein